METKLHTQPPYPLPGAPDTREIRTAHVPPIPHAPASHPTARRSRLGRRAGPAPALPGTSVLCAAGGADSAAAARVRAQGPSDRTTPACKLL